MKGWSRCMAHRNALRAARGRGKPRPYGRGRGRRAKRRRAAALDETQAAQAESRAYKGKAQIPTLRAQSSRALRMGHPQNAMRGARKRRSERRLPEDVQQISA